MVYKKGMKRGLFPIGKGSTMRAAILTAFACFVLLWNSGPAPSQAAKNKELLVGKWDIGMETTIEYKKDGSLVMKIRDATINGKYTFVDNETIEVEITVGDKTKKN